MSDNKSRKKRIKDKNQKKSFNTRLTFEALEKRILLSADIGVALPDAEQELLLDCEQIINYQVQDSQVVSGCSSVDPEPKIVIEGLDEFDLNTDDVENNVAKIDQQLEVATKSSQASAELIYAAQQYYSQAVKEVVFIDSTIEDYQQLIESLFATEKESNELLTKEYQIIIADHQQIPQKTQQLVDQTEDFETIFSYPILSEQIRKNLRSDIDIYLLNPDADGVSQISQVLVNYEELAAVHLISHGSTGVLRIGNSQLSTSTLSKHSEKIKGWRQALTHSADILLYGCNVADGEVGVEFIKDLSYLSGADVAASDDATGSGALGGDWQLEYSTGIIETEIAHADHYAFLLETINGTNKHDNLVGTDVNDIINGLESNDDLNGGKGNDKLDGGKGNDRYSFDDNWGVDTVDDSSGKETLNFESVTKNISISIIAGKLTITDSSTNKVTVLNGNIQNIILNNVKNNTIDLSALTDANKAAKFKVVGRNKVELSYGDINVTIDKVHNLKGGAGKDIFIIQKGTLKGKIDGGAGTDNTLSYIDNINKPDSSGGFGSSISFNLNTSTAPVINQGADNGFRNIHTVYASKGNDGPLIAKAGVELHGAKGDDRIEGSDEADTKLFGDAGDDTLNGKLENDELFGGKGGDTYVFEGEWGRDTIHENIAEGADKLDLTAIANKQIDFVIKDCDGTGISIVSGNNEIKDAKFIERILLANSTETYSFTFYNDWAKDLEGSSAKRTLTIEALDANQSSVALSGTTDVMLDFSNVTVDLLFIIDKDGLLKVQEQLPQNSGNIQYSELLIRAENISSIIGGKGNNTYQVLEDGSVTGKVSGGAENQLDGKVNTLDYSQYHGDAGIELKSITDFDSNKANGFFLNAEGGYKGINRIIGSDTNDTMVVSDFPEGVLLDGGKGNDRLDGKDLTADELHGGANNDVLFGDGGGDTLYGDSGNDILHGGDNVTADSTDKLFGGAGNDVLYGEQGNDILFGGAGNDLLIGGADNDSIRGGTGDDVYQFKDGWGQDTVFESKNGGTDTLDFSQVTGSLTHVLDKGALKTGSAAYNYTPPTDSFIDYAKGTISGNFVSGGDLLTASKAKNLNETQQIVLGSASSGRFTLSVAFNGSTITTDDITLENNSTITASNIEKELNEKLGTDGKVIVSVARDQTNAWDIEFIKPTLANIEQLTIHKGTLNSDSLVSRTKVDGHAIQEQQELIIKGVSTGTFTLEIEGKKTANITLSDDNATALAIKTELEKLQYGSGLLGKFKKFDVEVGVRGEKDWVINFLKPSDRDVGEIVVNATGLGNAASIEVKTLREGLAPSGLEHIEKIIASGADNTFIFGNDWGLKKLFNKEPDYVTAWNNTSRTIELDTRLMLDPTRNDVSLIVLENALNPVGDYSTVDYSFNIDSYDAGHDTLTLNYDLTDHIANGATISLISKDPSQDNNAGTYTVEKTELNQVTLPSNSDQPAETVKTTQLTVQQALAYENTDLQLRISQVIKTPVVVTQDDDIKVSDNFSQHISNGDNISLHKADGSKTSDFAIIDNTVTGDNLSITVNANVLTGSKWLVTTPITIPANNVDKPNKSFDLSLDAGLNGNSFALNDKVAALDSNGNITLLTVESYSHSSVEGGLIKVVEDISNSSFTAIAHVTEVREIIQQDELTFNLDKGVDPGSIFKIGEQLIIGDKAVELKALSYAALTNKVILTTVGNVADADLAAVKSATTVVKDMAVSSFNRGNDTFIIEGDRSKFFQENNELDFSELVGAGFVVASDAIYDDNTKKTTVTVQQALDSDVSANNGQVERHFDVVAVDAGNDTLTLSGNQLGRYDLGDTLLIEKGANKGLYTITSLKLKGADTEIEVQQGLSSNSVGPSQVTVTETVSKINHKSDQFEIKGNHTSRFTVGEVFNYIDITDSTAGNNAKYKVGTVVYIADLDITQITLDDSAGVGFRTTLSQDKTPTGILYLSDELKTIKSIDNGNDTLRIKGNIASAIQTLINESGVNDLLLAVKDSSGTNVAGLKVNKAEAPVYIAENKLVLDFRNVSQELSFIFGTDAKGNQTLSVSRVASASLLNNIAKFGTAADLATSLFFPDKNFATINITNINEHTIIYGGGDKNTFTIKEGTQFAGTVEGSIGLRNPLEVVAEALSLPHDTAALILPSTTVINTVDFSQNINPKDPKSYANLIGAAATYINLGNSVVAGLGNGPSYNSIRVAGKTGFTGKVTNMTSATYGSGANVVLGSGVGGFSSAGDVAKGVFGNVLFGRNHFTNAGKLDLSINTDGLGSKATIAAQAYNRLIAERMPTWSPGIHLLSGKAGADTYNFQGIWGIAAILEVPDLSVAGVALPEGYDTLDFSKVATDLHFTILEVTTDNIASLQSSFSVGSQRPAFGVGSNIVIVSDALFDLDQDSLPLTPFDQGINYVIANDIENIIGGSAKNTISFIGGAEVQGTITSSSGGSIVLDYSHWNDFKGLGTPFDHKTGVKTDLGVWDQTLISPTTVANGTFSIPKLSFEFGTASGIQGNRLAGIDEIIKAFGIDMPTDNLAINNVSKIISSTGDDILIGNSARDNTFVLGKGGTDDVDGIGFAKDGNTISYEGASETVSIDLESNIAVYDGNTSTLANIQNLAGGDGDDSLKGNSEKNIFFFSDGWGTDTVVTRGGGDVLNFSAVTSRVTHLIDGNNNVYTTAKGDRVTVVGSYDTTETNKDKNLDPANANTGWTNLISPLPLPFLLQASEAEMTSLNANNVTTEQLAIIAKEAINRWLSVISGEQGKQQLEGYTFTVADLPTAILGSAGDQLITVDSDAAGIGWFIDTTPKDNKEFISSENGVLVAKAGTDADGRVDLLTVVMHELGHLLGLQHTADGRLLSASIDSGVRLTPTVTDGLAIGGVAINGALLTLKSTEQTAINKGFAVLGDWAAGFENKLASQFGPEIPFTGKTLADLLEIGSIDIQAKINDLAATLNGLFDNEVTEQQLATQGITIVDEKNRQFNATIELIAPIDEALNIDVNQISMPEDFLGLDLDFSSFGLSGNIPAFNLTAGIQFNFDFGLDSNGEFYVANAGARADIAFGEEPASILAINQGGHSISVTGNQSSQFLAGALLEIAGSTDNDGGYIIDSVNWDQSNNSTRITVINALSNINSTVLGQVVNEEGESFTITVMDKTGDSLQLQGDLRTEYAIGDNFMLSGSTGNDGQYIITDILVENDLTTFFIEQELNFYQADGYIRSTFDAEVNLGPLAIELNNAVLGFNAGVFVGTEQQFGVSELKDDNNAVSNLDLISGLSENSAFDVFLPLQVATPLSGLEIAPIILNASSSIGLPTAQGLPQMMSQLAYLFPSTMGLNDLIKFNGFSLDDILNIIDYALDELAGNPTDNPETVNTDEQGLIYKDMPLVGQSVAQVLSTDWNTTVEINEAKISHEGKIKQGLKIFHNGSGGSFNLVDGENIVSLNFDDLANDVETTLRSLWNDVQVVAGNGSRTNPWQLVFSAVRNTPPLATIDASHLTTDFITILRDSFKEVRAAVTDLSGFETAINLKLKDLLGIEDSADNPVVLAYQDSSFIFDLELDAAFSSQVDLSVDLGDYLGDYESLALGLDVESEAKIDVLAGASLDIGLTFDLTDVSDPTVYFDDDTGLEFYLDITESEPFNFKTAIDVPLVGSVGLFAKDGAGSLQLSGRAGLIDDSDDDSRYSFNEFSDNFELVLDGHAELILPLYFPAESIPLGGISADFDNNGIVDNALYLNVDIGKSGLENIERYIPSLVPSFDLFAILNDPGQVLNGLEEMFEGIKGSLESKFSQLALPLVGDELKDAAQFIDVLRAELLGIQNADTGLDGNDFKVDLANGRYQSNSLGQALLDAYNNGDSTSDILIDLVKEAIYSKFGKPGLNILTVSVEDADGNPIIDTLSGQVKSKAVESVDEVEVILDGESIQFNLMLADNVFQKNVGLDFATSLPGFKLGSDAGLEVSLDYVFGLGFGFDGDGIYVDTEGVTESGSEFDLSLFAGLSEGSELDAQIGFLSATLIEQLDDDGNSGLFGGISFDLIDDDNRWHIGESIEAVGRFEANANIDLAIDVGVDGVESLPEVFTILHYDQVFADVELSSQAGGSASLFETPEVVFEGVTLDLGSLLTGVLGPALEEVNKIIGPETEIYKLVNLLNTTIDLGITTFSLVDLTYLKDPSGNLAKGINAFLSAFETVASLSELVADAKGEAILIPFGDFVIGGSALENPDAELTTANTSASKTDAQRKEDANKATTGKKSADVTKKIGTESGSFQLPIMSDPMSVLGYLMGKNVDLFLWDMPDLALDFNYTQSVPVFPGLNARLGAEIKAYTDLAFGFDTTGISHWQEEDFDVKDADLILEGFYFTDWDENGDDKPEVVLEANIIAGASVGIGGLVEAGVDGGLSTRIELDLNDKPKEGTGGKNQPPAIYDGKLFFDEVADRLDHGVECLFDLHGEMSAFLEAFFWTGVKVFGAEITLFEARERFVDYVIAEFDYSCIEQNPTVATIHGGDTLVLAYDPEDGNIGDQKEKYKVSYEEGYDWFGDGSSLRDVYKVSGNGHTQFFESKGIKKISAAGTQFDDNYKIDTGNQLVDIEIHGNKGNDTIEIASEAVGQLREIFGDDGDDFLVGSELIDKLYGGNGDDVIYGAGGSDFLYGQKDKDFLIGGEGVDSLFGGSEEDYLAGNSGADFLYGGTGSDTFDWYAGDGGDKVFGDEKGNLNVSKESIKGDHFQIHSFVRDNKGIVTDDAINDQVNVSSSNKDINLVFNNDHFILKGIGWLDIDTGEGADNLKFLDLSQTTLNKVSVAMGTERRIVKEDRLARDKDGNETEIEEFDILKKDFDNHQDIVEIIGKTTVDEFVIESGGKVDAELGENVDIVRIKQTDGVIFEISEIDNQNNAAYDRIIVDAAEGDDTIDATALTKNLVKDLRLLGGSGDDTLIGSDYSETIIGGIGADRITGGLGVDVFIHEDYQEQAHEYVNDELQRDTLVEQRNADFKVSDNTAKIADEVEVLNSIFEAVELTGGENANEFNLENWSGNGVLNGADGSDTYVVTLAEQAEGVNFINVIDSGTDGRDTLDYTGSSETDLIQMDTVYQQTKDSDSLFSSDRWLDYGVHGDGLLIAHYGAALAGYGRKDINDTESLFEVGVSSLLTSEHFQVLNYSTIEEVKVSGSEGDDVFISDDTATNLNVYGNEGDDQFYIGSILKTEDVLVEGQEITVALEVTQGASFVMNFYGGDDDDYFEVSHNAADINLYGDNGDDTFFIKALLTLDEEGKTFDLGSKETTVNAGKQESDDNDTREVDVDTLVYVENANVNIDGGAGFDSVAVVGTALSDTFYSWSEKTVDGDIIQRIFGAGIKLSQLVNIERLVLLTGAGDDKVYVNGVDLGPNADMVINLGSGSDEVFVGHDLIDFKVNFPTQNNVEYATLLSYAEGSPYISFLSAGKTIYDVATSEVIVPYTIRTPAHSDEEKLPSVHSINEIKSPLTIIGGLGAVDRITVSNKTGSDEIVFSDTVLLKKQIETNDELITFPVTSALQAGDLTDLLNSSVENLIEVREMVANFIRNHVLFQDKYINTSLIDDLSGLPTDEPMELKLAEGISYAVFQDTKIDVPSEFEGEPDVKEDLTARDQLSDFLQGTGYKAFYEDYTVPGTDGKEVFKKLTKIENDKSHKLAFETQNQTIKVNDVLHYNMIGVSLITAAESQFEVAAGYIKTVDVIDENALNRIYTEGQTANLFFEGFDELELNLNENSENKLLLDNSLFTGISSIYGGSLNDQFTVYNSAAKTLLYGEKGDDDYLVGNGTVDGILAELFLLGGEGNDSVEVNSQALNADADVSIDKNYLKHQLEQQKLNKISNLIGVGGDNTISVAENAEIIKRLSEQTTQYIELIAGSEFSQFEQAVALAGQRYATELKALFAAAETEFDESIDQTIDDVEEVYLLALEQQIKQYQILIDRQPLLEAAKTYRLTIEALQAEHATAVIEKQARFDDLDNSLKIEFGYDYASTVSVEQLREDNTRIDQLHLKKRTDSNAVIEVLLVSYKNAVIDVTDLKNKFADEGATFDVIVSRLKSNLSDRNSAKLAIDSEIEKYTVAEQTALNNKLLIYLANTDGAVTEDSLLTSIPNATEAQKQQLSSLAKTYKTANDVVVTLERKYSIAENLSTIISDLEADIMTVEQNQQNSKQALIDGLNLTFGSPYIDVTGEVFDLILAEYINGSKAIDDLLATLNNGHADKASDYEAELLPLLNAYSEKVDEVARLALFIAKDTQTLEQVKADLAVVVNDLDLENHLKQVETHKTAEVASQSKLTTIESTVSANKLNLDDFIKGQLTLVNLAAEYEDEFSNNKSVDEVVVAISEIFKTDIAKLDPDNGDLDIFNNGLFGLVSVYKANKNEQLASAEEANAYTSASHEVQTLFDATVQEQTDLANTQFNNNAFDVDDYLGRGQLLRDYLGNTDIGGANANVNAVAVTITEQFSRVNTAINALKDQVFHHIEIKQLYDAIQAFESGIVNIAEGVSAEKDLVKITAASVLPGLGVEGIEAQLNSLQVVLDIDLGIFEIATDFTDITDFSDVKELFVIGTESAAKLNTLISKYKQVESLAKDYNLVHTQELSVFRNTLEALVRMRVYANYFPDTGSLNISKLFTDYTHNLNTYDVTANDSARQQNIKTKAEVEAKLGSLEKDQLAIERLVKNNGSASEYHYRVFFWGGWFNFSYQTAILTDPIQQQTINNAKISLNELSTKVIELNKALNDANTILKAADEKLSDLDDELSEQFLLIKALGPVVLEVLSENRTGIQLRQMLEADSSLITTIKSYNNDYSVVLQEGKDIDVGPNFSKASFSTVTSTVESKKYSELLSLTGLNEFGIHADYEQIESLTLNLGDGDDAVVIGDSLKQATSRVQINTAKGDDRVKVSNETKTVDDIVGILAIDAGGGKNALIVDDSTDQSGDTVVMLYADDNYVQLTGMAAGDVFYKASGGFSKTLKVTTTAGDDNITINALHGKDHTEIFSIQGNDVVVVNDFKVDADASLTIYAGKGKDLVDATAAPLGVIMYGHQGDDKLLGSQYRDIIFADHGKVEYDDKGHLIRVNNNEGQNQYSGNNFIDAGEGDNIVLAGDGNDQIKSGSGYDIIIADQGEVMFSHDKPIFVEASLSKGGNDTIHTGNGQNLVFGGAGKDNIQGGADKDILLGDHGDARMNGRNFSSVAVNLHNSDGNDHLFGAAGNDVLIGGAGSDLLSGDNGNDVLLGDGDNVIFYKNEAFHFETIDTTLGGVDTLIGGSGTDFMFGGFGQDIIHGNLRDDVFVGDYAIFTSDAKGGRNTLVLGPKSQDLASVILRSFYNTSFIGSQVIGISAIDFSSAQQSNDKSPAESPDQLINRNYSSSSSVKKSSDEPSFNELPPSGAGGEITVQIENGDTLWDIAARYLGDKNRWPELLELNPWIENPDDLSAGQQIKLPPVKNHDLLKNNKTDQLQKMEQDISMVEGVGLVAATAFGTNRTKHTNGLFVIDVHSGRLKPSYRGIGKTKTIDDSSTIIVDWDKFGQK